MLNATTVKMPFRVTSLFVALLSRRCSSFVASRRHFSLISIAPERHPSPLPLLYFPIIHHVDFTHQVQTAEGFSSSSFIFASAIFHHFICFVVGWWSSNHVSFFLVLSIFFLSLFPPPFSLFSQSLPFFFLVPSLLHHPFPSLPSSFEVSLHRFQPLVASTFRYDFVTPLPRFSFLVSCFLFSYKLSHARPSSHHDIFLLSFLPKWHIFL